MEFHWTDYYEKLKKEILDHRKTGQLFKSTEINSFNAQLKTLEKSLETIQLSPMEYEM
jgi:hypothetical protein